MCLVLNGVRSQSPWSKSPQSKSPSQNPPGQIPPGQNTAPRFIFQLESYLNVITVFFDADSDKK